MAGYFHSIVKFCLDSGYNWVEVGDCIKDYMSILICMDITPPEDPDKITKYDEFMVELRASYGDDYDIKLESSTCHICDDREEHGMLTVTITEKSRVSEISDSD